MASRNDSQQEVFDPRAVIFHEPDPDKPVLREQPKPQRTSEQPEPKRRRVLDPDILSAKLTNNTQWRLTLYCRISGYGVKDAVVKAATGFLGLGPYPTPFRLEVVRSYHGKVPFVAHERRKGISVRLDPELAERIRRDAADMQESESAWTELALTAFFNHMRLPSREE